MSKKRGTTNVQLRGLVGALYPTTAQQKALTKVFGCARFVFNQYTNYRQWEYEHGYTGDKKTPYSKVRSLITVKNKKTQYPWLREVSSIVLQNAVQQADDAYKNMVARRSEKKKASLPRRKKNGTQSFRITGIGATKIRFVDEKRHRGHVYIPKIGWIKFHCGLTFDPDTVSSYTVKRNRDGSFSISFTLPQTEKFHDPDAADVGGFDVGLTTLVAGSDSSGNRWDVTPPKFYRKSQRKIARRNREVSRKKKGSSNRKKAVRKLAKQHKKVKHQRTNYLHQTSHMMASKNHAVVMETLNVAGMARNHKLAKSIYDASWSTLKRFVEYKCAQRGGVFVQVDQFLPSSQTCSICHVNDGKKGLSVRQWTCSNGHVLDRDHNSGTFLIDAGGYSESLNASGEDISRLLSAPLSLVKEEYFCTDYIQAKNDNPWLHIYSLKKKPLP